MAEHQDLLRRRVAEGDALLEIGSGGGEFAQEEADNPERITGLQEQGWSRLALRQPVELFPQLPPRGQRPPVEIELTQAPQHREKLGGVADLLAQRPCPGVGLLYLLSCVPLSRHQGRSQGNLHVDFAIRRADPLSPGAPCRDKLHWMQSMLD